MLFILSVNNRQWVIIDIYISVIATQLVGQALVATLEDGLKEEFTKEVKEAYIAFYTLVSQAMKEGLQEFSTTDTEQEPRT